MWIPLQSPPSPSPTAQAALLSLGSAVFYSGSMAAMKAWTQAPARPLLAVIAGAIALAAMFEVMALRTARLGTTYVSILACEVGLIALISRFGFGEQFTPKEIAGGALIAIGAGLAWS